MNEKTCETCRFWQKDGRQYAIGVPIGECRVGGPSRTKDNRKWPETNGIDWCGRWKEEEDVVPPPKVSVRELPPGWTELDALTTVVEGFMGPVVYICRGGVEGCDDRACIRVLEDGNRAPDSCYKFPGREQPGHGRCSWELLRERTGAGKVAAEMDEELDRQMSKED